MARFILTLVRHGQTIYNQDGIIQGQMDVPLSEEGRKQIWLLGKALEHHRFTKIFASDLQRAAETAQAVVDLGTVERPPVITDPRLRERGYGDLEGVPLKEYQGQAKKHQQQRDFTPEGGETMAEVRKRAVDFFKELCDDFLEGNSLLTPPEKCSPAKQGHKAENTAGSKPKGRPADGATVGSNHGDKVLPEKHRKNYRPLCGQYAPNVTVRQSLMQVGESEKPYDAIEISYSDGSLNSHGADDHDYDEEIDLDGMAADVLVVAHGVLIRVLMKYFTEELNCFVPKNRNLMNRVTFNTGMSRFQVDLLDGNPKLECLTIHQIDHLQQP